MNICVTHILHISIFIKRVIFKIIFFSRFFQLPTIATNNPLIEPVSKGANCECKDF